MDRMARGPEPIAPAPQAVTELVSPVNSYIEGVPLEIYHYFDLHDTDLLPTEKPKVKEMVEYMRGKMAEPTLGNYMLEFRNIERKLGQPEMHETRWERVYKHIKLSKAIDELRKQQQSMERFW